MAQWACKAFQTGQAWSIAALREFGTTENIPGGATEIWMFVAPMQRSILYLYSEENGAGVPTTMNFGPGGKLDSGNGRHPACNGRITVDVFKSWSMFVNTMHSRGVIAGN